ncbi:GNAT family N-acetyltransferase [Chitinophaga nivalis]|uniref:GNAT family N-acetyltransferase n=1 Tax=Chitinophaga nivalis TaxID=2991709 RepID=A0ABT3IKT7_9BACT|nr:GNAT family N-acetyltransferase [Chitinophaga nivalis]MCW3465756.1 GNAT family N-acetyltransferase [Chitinophaga nivalis]MCW3484553.1 GNAT family N-acetyltransferase [Chitinophaga nivalis]
MQFLKSTPEDISVIMELYEAATAYQHLYTDRVWKGFDPAMIEREIAEGRQWKIVIDQQVACVFLITESDPYIWLEMNADPAVYIHRISTNPAFRGNSFVKHIINWAKEFAREQNKLFIRVDTGCPNPKLEDYYLRCGFTPKGITHVGETDTLPKHYQNNDYALFEMKVDA